MDKLFEFVVPKLPDIVACLCPNFKKKVTLQRKIRLLKIRKDEIDKKIQNAGKNLRREVEVWRNDVENIKNEFEKWEQVEKSSRFYHVFKRQELAEQIQRMIEEVTELVDQSKFPGGPFLEVDESIDRLLLIPRPNGQAFEQNFNDIWTSLMDANVVSIGIYGMGGVGKTTLARHVHDKLKESLRHVYWVTVSQEFSIYKLQTDIARELNLTIARENDEGKRAAKLFQEFKKMERFVLILDDVWERIDAEKIGIPSKMDGSKLVITSRSEDVCHRMCCKNIIKVNTLSEQEALDLFLKTLDCGEPSLEVKEICKKMVNRCGGLPLAIITLAGSMRGVIDIHEWKDASEGLKESCLGRADMKDEVLPILLYSYHRLRDTRLKSCFLNCSLYPEDFRISREELIEHFMSEELMERRLSWEAEFNQGHAILNQLVRACLLETDSDGRLKMHDLIREMAIGITKDNPPRYMVKAGLHLEELPEEQEWTEDLDKVSLMCNSIEEISPGTSPKCPSLSTLILRENPLRLIADCFFTQMCGLRTLDLSKTEIESLPNSISDLVKLNALVLTGCFQLVSVPSLEKLKVLKHLSLKDTSIEEVPQGMESLTNLKSLSLLCSTLEMIPTGTLHRLTHLQQLEWPDHIDVPIEEVETLKQLAVLNCRLNSKHDLNRLINARRIDKPLCFYNIRVGTRGIYTRIELESQLKILCFTEDVRMESSLDTYENKLPRDIKDLSFSGSGLSGCLLDEFPTLSSARNLKECTIEREDKIECIMRLEEEQQSSGVPFQSLERLELEWLPNFIGLFKWEAVAAPLPPGTFSCLRRLSIYKCGKIKKVFPQSLVHNFHNLEHLAVEVCAQMEEIIEDDKNEGADITLPRLKRFYLKHLPQVKSICKGKMICDSITSISLSGNGSGLSGCLFPTLSSARNLKKCTIKREDKIECIMRLEEEQQSSGVPFQSLERLKLEWLPNFIGLFKWEAVAAPLPPGTFSCLRRLSIYKCGKIKKVFPQSLVHNFHNLEHLAVEVCAQMEEIIEDDKNEGADITLPRLKRFSLDDLPQVKSICKGKMICDSIENISLRGSGLSVCLLDKFPTLSSARNLEECTVVREDKIECIMRLEEEQQSSGVPFQSLERLELEWLPNFIGLFKWEAVAAPLPPGTFSCLRRLSIYECGKIKKVFPQSLVHDFHNLEHFAVHNCAQMEEIIEDDKNEGADIALPRLKRFCLTNMPQVKSICKGKMICYSIQYIRLGGIKNIKEFPLYLPLLDDGQLSHPPSLPTIRIDREEKEWWESLKWPHHNAKNVLQRLVEFELDVECITDSDASESGEEEENQC
ncbi:probable disease resistance At5g63020 [Olea europaea subsp. europaea]|uniref:Probable disease resistance At5g63020 n=1 Tax=Olea europaea subsp. europaea TaxID=158383 RepID=A0A8S0UTE6_OLEEU|nr:probable disease resistance At5g63020 [Olea europaea subsp. europaea]